MSFEHSRATLTRLLVRSPRVDLAPDGHAIHHGWMCRQSPFRCYAI